jgi:hypothetical protein
MQINTHSVDAQAKGDISLLKIRAVAIDGEQALGYRLPCGLKGNLVSQPFQTLH